MQTIIESSLAEMDFTALGIQDQVLLVTGKGSYRGSGAAAVLDGKLQGKTVCRFSGFETNPRLEDVVKGIRLLDTAKPCTIMAVGGGSPMDMAKLIKALSGQKGELADYIKGKDKPLPNPQINLIAIPTTSGSGSESTHFAVVYINKVKFSLAIPELLPETVILDPNLTASMSPYQTACSGFDALAQAVESYWSVNAGEESREYSREAVTLVAEHLERAVNAPAPENRAAMQRAANLAGRAINLTKTTAAHAFCYFLTSRFGTPHGHAAGLLLGKFFIFNSRVSKQDLSDPASSVESVRNSIDELSGMLGVETAEEADHYLSMLLEKCGLESDINKIMDLDRYYDDFYSSVNVERLGNNPRRVTDRAELLKLLES